MDESRRKELREKLLAIWTELLQLGENPENLIAMLKQIAAGDAPSASVGGGVLDAPEAAAAKKEEKKND